MQNSRATFFLSAFVGLSIAYLLALTAYICSISAQPIDLITDESQQSVYAINFIATLLALISLASISWHFIRPHRATPTALILSTVLVSTIATILLVSKFMFAS